MSSTWNLLKKFEVDNYNYDPNGISSFLDLFNHIRNRKFISNKYFYVANNINYRKNTDLCEHHLYFYDINSFDYDMHNYDSRDIFIWDVIIPPDANVTRFRSNIYGTNKFFLKNGRPLYDEYEMWKYIIKKDGKKIRNLPDKYRSYELCLLAVQQNPYALDYVNQTEELCKLAVRQDGKALQYVKNQTEDICKLAVQQDGIALYYAKLKTEEICQLAVKQNGNALQYVPLNIINQYICKLAVQQDGYALQYVKEKFQTEEICQLAVKKNGKALQYVNEKLKTEEICKLSIENDSSAMMFIKDEEIYYKIVA
jgi:hypothetical protein